MCIAMTGEVLSTEGEGALVRIGNQTRWASTALVPEVRPGDLVLVSALTVVERLSMEEARSIEAFAQVVREG